MRRSEIVVVTVYFVGIALILAGQFVYRYAMQTIADLEAKLSQPLLPQSEYWNLQGALDWWRPALISIYGPVSIYLTTAGIAVLVSMTVYVVITLIRRKREHVM